jgi:hypothetical protein
MAEPKVIEIAQSGPDPDFDPFDDLDRLRVPQDYDTRAGGKKRLTITVGRPGNQTYFRIKRDWQFTTTFIEVQGERRTLYMVMPGVLDGVLEEAKLTCVTMTLRLYVDRDGRIGLWPLRLSDSDSGDNSYARSAHAAAELAISCWIRVKADQDKRSYEVFGAVNQVAYGEPEWPQLSQSEILRMAFKDRLIDRPDHLIVQKLLGAI